MNKKNTGGRVKAFRDETLDPPIPMSRKMRLKELWKPGRVRPKIQ
jgi:hypothetical protein